MKITTGHLLRAVKYPDTTNAGHDAGCDRERRLRRRQPAYNAQGQETYRKDQAGNVFETDYDDSGRQIHRRVTTLAGGFNGTAVALRAALDDVSVMQESIEQRAGRRRVAEELAHSSTARFEVKRRSTG